MELYFWYYLCIVSCQRMTINGTAMKIWRDSITMEAGKASKAFEARQARIAFETSIGSQHLKRSKDVKEWSKFPEFFFEGISGQTQTNQSGDGSDGGGDGMVASVHPPPPPPPAPPPSTEPTIKVKITDKNRIAGGCNKFGRLPQLLKQDC